MSRNSQDTALPTDTPTEPSVANTSVQTKEDKTSKLFKEAKQHYLNEWKSENSKESVPSKYVERLDKKLKDYSESYETFVSNRKHAGVSIPDDFSLVDMVNMDDNMYEAAERLFKANNPNLESQLRDHLNTEPGEKFTVQVDPIGTSTASGTDFDGTGYKGVGLVKRIGTASVLYEPHTARKGFDPRAEQTPTPIRSNVDGPDFFFLSTEQGFLAIRRDNNGGF